MTLVKLRLGVPHKDLAYRLDVSEKSIGYIFRRWIDVMSVELQFLIVWPEKEALACNMPKTFKKHFIKTRCIIDCFEIFIQCPTSFVARAQTYNQYKKQYCKSFDWSGTYRLYLLHFRCMGRTCL